jgi:hypothetical protein
VAGSDGARAGWARPLADFRECSGALRGHCGHHHVLPGLHPLSPVRYGAREQRNGRRRAWLGLGGLGVATRVLAARRLASDAAASAAVRAAVKEGGGVCVWTPTVDDTRDNGVHRGFLVQCFESLTADQCRTASCYC